MKEYSRDHGRSDSPDKLNEECFMDVSTCIISCIYRYM